MDTQEQQRRQSNADKLLTYLQTHKKATNSQLLHVAGFRFGARIQELRKDGYMITTNKLKGGIFEYVYDGHRDEINNQASLFMEGL